MPVVHLITGRSSNRLFVLIDPEEHMLPFLDRGDPRLELEHCR